MEPEKDMTNNLVQTNGLPSSREKINIRIIIGSEVFLSNQSILSSCSTYFQALLSSNTNVSEILSLLIKGIDAQTFANVLHMITKGDNKMTENNMLAMWRAAHHLKIDSLIELCEHYVSAHVTEENYLNIYQHAIAFKSETVHEKILLLMIRNFDRFIKTDTFLNLTPKTLIEIITSAGIKSYDNVIVAIFDWINYTRTERLQSCGESPKEENKAKQSYGNADWYMEVSFHDRDLFPNTDNHPINRAELLGELISLVQFDLITTDGLRNLLDNDDVMENRDARNAVRRAISSQLENDKLVMVPVNAEEMTSKAMSLSDLTIRDISSGVAFSSSQVEHNIVFLDRCQRVLSLNLLQNTIFQLTFEITGSIEDILVLEHKLHLMVNRSFVDPIYQLRLYQISDYLDFDQSIICYFGPKNRIKFIINGSFYNGFISTGKKCLKIIQNKSYYPFQLNWATFEFNGVIGDVLSLVNYENEIVGFFSAEREGGDVINIYSFNTYSKYFYFIVSLKGSAKNLATFTFKKRLFVIQGCGDLTELYRQDGVGRLRANSQPPLWNIPLKIFGAVMLNKILFVMARLENVRHLPTTCQFGRIKFVHLINGTNICQYMAVPSHWLLDEI
ncbi:kelch protein 40 [Biomphalaria glabrata]|nr:kelch protein 40 [Biomphalaria glabrata]